MPFMVMEQIGSMRHTRDLGAVRSISVAVAFVVFGLLVHALGQSRGIEVAIRASEAPGAAVVATANASS